MAIKIGANFAYNGKLANFERDSFETKAAMKAFNENNIDEGHLSYCKEDGKTYQYKSANTVDTVTGRWRVFKTDIVVDAALNGSSTNAIQNKAVFEALKAKADSVALDKYQPKYKADYVATRDFKYAELPSSAVVVDLNGYTITISTPITNNLIIYNGEIKVVDETIELDMMTVYNTHVYPATNETHVTIVDVTFYNCNINYPKITSGGAEFHFCTIDDCIFDNNVPIATNSIITNYTIIGNSNQQMRNVVIDGTVYKSAIIKDNKFVEAGYVSDIYASNVAASNAPSCEAVKDALQLKTDKTQLDDYLTKTNADTTYVTKDSLNNEVNQLVEEINLKLDDTVAASTYLRQDDANTTYAKKTDITNIYKFKGTKTNYSDLPKTGVIAGDVWNITNADAEHGIKAGDNVAWDGSKWDNLSGVADLSGYATTTTTDAISADVKKLMDKAFPFTVKVSLDKTLAKKGTSQAVKVTITPKIGDDNTNVDEIMINGAEYHGTTPYVHSDTATTTTTYNVRVRKDTRTAQGSATITFVNPSYDGAVAANFTVTEASIKALTEAVRSGKGGTRTFNLNNQKACIAYPKAFGAATSIKDANGFDYLASYTRSELNVNGELYYVYLLTNATTITDMKQTVS